MTIIPINDKVLLKPIKPSETTETGVFILKSDQTHVYEVLNGGKLVEVGDKVYCKRGAGEYIKADGEEYVVVDEDSIISKVL